MRSLQVIKATVCVLAATNMLASCSQKSLSGSQRSANQAANPQQPQATAQAPVVQKGPETKFEYQMAGKLSDLPACAGPLNGMIYYVWDEQKFYICDVSTSTWVNKDLTGAAGANGLNSLIEQKSLPIGDANCANGGMSITSYLDNNRDGKFTVNVDTNVQVNYICQSGSTNDTDGDTILNQNDNCPLIANVDQKNVDNDSFGDVCDTQPLIPNTTQEDKDKDGIADATDNCPDYPNASQKDENGNGVGDICDSRLLISNMMTLIFKDACTECNLSNVFLRGLDMEKPLLTSANLRGTNLQNTEAVEGDFRNADMSEANMFSINAKNAKFTGGLMVNAKLGEAELNGADFSYTNLTGADLKKAVLKGANLTNAVLKEADFTGADMTGVIGFNKATCGCKAD